MFSTITITGGACLTCGGKRYWPSNEVIKGAAGKAKCQSCGWEGIVVNKFFEILERSYGPVGRLANSCSLAPSGHHISDAPCSACASRVG